MQNIPIIEAKRAGDSNGTERKTAYSSCRTLPASYMSEYSVLGLFVDDLQSALEVLRNRGITMTEEQFGAEIAISGRYELPGLVRTLSEEGIYAAIGDVIDSVYQG